MSLGRLMLWTVVDVLLAFVIGCVAWSLDIWIGKDDPDYTYYRGLEALGVPPRAVGLGARYEAAAARWRYSEFLDCKTTPPTDEALRAWLHQHPELRRTRVKRYPDYSDGVALTRIELRYTADMEHSRLQPPWTEFGYEEEPRSTYWKQASSPPNDVWIPTNAEFRLMFLAWMQLGIFLVGLFRMFRIRNLTPLVAPTTPAKPPLAELWVVLLGIGIGLGAGGIYWLYDQALLHWFGGQVHSWSAWRTMVAQGWNDSVDSSGNPFNNVRPHPAWLAALFITAIAGPIAQEIFFRGGMQTMWARSGKPWLGITLASVLGGLLFLDLTYLPFSIALGFVIGWLYQRTQSLLAPLLIHFISYALVLCVIYGAIPSLPHPANQLPGKWEPQSIEINSVISIRPLQRIEFDRGGAIYDGDIVQNIGGYRRVWPRRYVWSGPNTIRVLFQRASAQPNSRSVQNEVFSQEFEVSVKDDELFLTPVGAGEKFPIRYRRYFP